LASVEANSESISESVSRAEPQLHRPLVNNKIKRRQDSTQVLLKNDKKTNLVTIENTAVRSATPAIIQYFRACSPRLVTVFLLLYIFSFITQVLSNFWLSGLSNRPQMYQETRSKLLNYGLFFLLSFFSCLFVLFADFLFVQMFVHASKHLHDGMLSSLLKCNLRFFESTPVGRVINRFSKDIETLESKIPEAFKNSIRNGFQVIKLEIIFLFYCKS